MALVGVMTPIDEAMHLYDAAYSLGGSYTDAYTCLWLLYGQEVAMKGYKMHISNKEYLTYRECI